CAVAQNNDTPPNQPFQAIHLIKLEAGDADKLAAALTDANAAIVKAGCKTCIYRLWKVTGTQNGPFNYIWSSMWPGRQVYEKVHNDAGYQAALKKHPEVDEISKNQVYNRLIEVKTTK